MKLTDEQFQVLQLENDVPVKVEHEPTGCVFYLVPEGQFQAMKAAIEVDLVKAMEPLLTDLQPEDWEEASNYESW